MSQTGDGNGAGLPGGVRPGEFDAFLAQLAGTVAERVQQLNKKSFALPDAALLDESKTVIEWPEISAYILEELR